MSSQYSGGGSTSITKVSEVNKSGKWPHRKHNRRERKTLQTAMQYTPATPANFAVQPTTVDDALDQLAAQTSGTVQKTVAVTYDFSVNGGAVSAINLGTNIPSKAIIQSVTQDILVAPTSSGGTGTLHLGLPTDGALSANITADGTATLGASTQSTGVNVKTTAVRALTATIATTALTAGKVSWFITYVQSV